MSKPDNQQFQQDPALTAVAIGYRNEDDSLIGDEMLPRINVSDEDFKFMVYNEAEDFSVPDTRVGRRSSVNQVEIEGKETPASCEAFGIDIPLDKRTINQAEKKGWDPRKRATMRATDIVMLDRELRVMGECTNPDNYHDDNRAVLATEQSLYNPDSDPIDLILEMMDACLMRPNQLQFGTAGWRILRQHPKIVKAIHGNDGGSGVASKKAIADLFEVNKILVGRARLNIAKPGLQANIARAWPEDVVTGQYINSTADNNGGVTFGFTAMDGTKIAGTKQSDMGLEGGELVRSGEKVKELIVANRAGFILENVLSQPGE